MLEVLAWAILLLAGVAVGATSIGGVLVVPVLTLMLGIDTPHAIAAASLSFLLLGVFMWWQSPERGQGWRAGDVALLLSALLGAALGAVMTDVLPPMWVRRWLGVLALGSGLQTLWRVYRWTHPAQAGERAWLGPREQTAVGRVVGMGSALSGTGGPVMVMPYFLQTRRSLTRSVSAALLLQIPVGLAASAGHALAGRLQVGLSLLIGLVLMVGIVGGRWLARHSSVRGLMGATACVLVATGVWLLRNGG
jgi:uncharacterized membrane protein YfcA